MTAKAAKLRTHYLAKSRQDIEGRLNASLHQARFLDLGIEHDPGAIQPWGYYNPEQRKNYKSVEEIYSDSEGRLLLLGQPGAGKTTALLHIALMIARAAELDETAPVPVIVNLSKLRLPETAGASNGNRLFGAVLWGRNAAKDSETVIEDWLVDEIRNLPGMNGETARLWLKEGRFALLLDGLDEFNDDRCRELAQTLNGTLLRDHPTVPIVICCRINEYEVLRSEQSTRLSLNGAAILQPLSQRQVEDYLRAARAEDLLPLIAEDEAIAELSRTPLTLSVLVLAYAGAAPMPQERGTSSLSETRFRLFEAYVARMLQRQARRRRGVAFDNVEANNVPVSSYHHSPASIDRWFGWLALTLSIRMRTTFSPHELVRLLLLVEKPDRQFLNFWVAHMAVGLPMTLCLALVGVFLVSPQPRSIAVAAAIMLGSWILLPWYAAGSRGWPWGRPVSVVSVVKGFSMAAGLVSLAMALAMPVQMNRFMMAPSVAFTVISLMLCINFEEITDRYVDLIMSSVAFMILLVVINIFSFEITNFIYLLLKLYSLAHQGAVEGSEIGAIVVLILGPGVIILYELSIYRVYLRGLPISSNGIIVTIVMVPIFLFIAGFVSLDSWWGVIGVLSASVLFLGLMVNGVSSLLDIVLFCLAVTVGAVFVGPEGCAVAGLFAAAIRGWVQSSVRLAGWRQRFFTFLDKIVMSHFAWVLLALSRRLPFRQQPLLDAISETHFLKRSGEEYEFVHRLLRDYFALRRLMPRLAPKAAGRLEAIQALGYQGEAALDRLVEFVEQGDSPTRAAALLALRHIPSSLSTKCFRACVNDRASAVRCALLQGLPSLTQDNQEYIIRNLSPVDAYSEISLIIGNEIMKYDDSIFAYMSRMGVDVVHSLLSIMTDAVEKERVMAAIILKVLFTDKYMLEVYNLFLKQRKFRTKVLDLLPLSWFDHLARGDILSIARIPLKTRRRNALEAIRGILHQDRERIARHLSNFS